MWPYRKYRHRTSRSPAVSGAAPSRRLTPIEFALLPQIPLLSMDSRMDSLDSCMDSRTHPPKISFLTRSNVSRCIFPHLAPENPETGNRESGNPDTERESGENSVGRLVNKAGSRPNCGRGAVQPRLNATNRSSQLRMAARSGLSCPQLAQLSRNWSNIRLRSSRTRRFH